MSELLPYEDELAKQLHDLPVPDENMAWADMKRRLDEDEEDPILPVWLRGCALFSLLGLVLIILGWWLVKHETWFSEKKPIPDIGSISKKQAKQNDTSAINTINLNNTTQIRTNDTVSKKIDADTANAKPFSKEHLSDSLSNKNKEKEKITSNENYTDEKIPTTGSKHSKIKKRKIVTAEHIKVKSSNAGIGETTEENIKNEQVNKDGINSNDTKNTDSISMQVTKPKEIVKKDSLQKMAVDSAQKKNVPPTASVEKKKDSTAKKIIYFSAGVAMNQQLPIDGQQLITYNSSGRKGALTDYIPSVYFRMYKEKKWFIQTEFRYGAPQYTKDLVYQQKNTVDSAGNITIADTTTSNHLKKTYYHQLPVTFNYFVLPNWSVGVGFIWNKFVSAVSEQDITEHNSITGTDTVLSKGAIINPKQADSNFVSSYFQSVIETEYQWKKFSFGIRYAFGLSPYIKFTLPGSGEQQEKNQSFLLFIRYELWRSKKK